MLTPVGRLWNRVGATFERTDIALAGAPQNDARSGEDMVRRTTTRYASIRQAVERRVHAFLCQDLVSHLEIGVNEIFLLHYIEITADGMGAPTLAQFLREFSPESRVQWVKRLLGPAVGKHVSVDQFLALDQQFTADELSETDPFEDKLNQGATPLYRVILHGRWESGSAATPSVAAAADQSQQQQQRTAGPCLHLSIRDGKSAGGMRVMELEHFPAVLGSSVHADVEISGYYVSARHCTLHSDGQQIFLTDHSTNGTWVDGERAQRGSRVALANGAALGFGRGQGEAEHDRFAEIRTHLGRRPAAPAAGFTPVAPSQSTPVAPGITTLPSPPAGKEKAPLAVLAIADASGSPRRDVIRLPFAIGRGSAQDYVVPDANQGVSREHLVIEEINRSGAVTLNRAVSRNGTFAGDRALPERFVWRFGEEIVLGEKWANAPAVRLSLLRVEDTL